MSQDVPGGGASSPQFAIVGRVRKAHGVRGELVVELHTDAPDAIFASGRRLFAGTVDGDVARGAPELTVVSSRPFKGGLIVALAEVRDRDAAELWRDRFLLVPTSELSAPADDEVYYHELIGMRVQRAGGELVGEVEGLYELPLGLTLEVRPPGKPTILIPYRPEIVTSVDVKDRVMTIEPPEGLLE
jgi:16S rRNA processing protein RimM